MIELIILWCFLCACLLFVWVIGKGTVALTQRLQAPPAPPCPPRPDPRQEAEAKERARRCAAAAAACRLLYARHAPELAPRLPPQAFEDLVHRHVMSDDPETAEKGALQVQELLYHHLQRAEPELPRAAARSEAERFYEAHPELHTVYPRARVRAELHAHIPDTATPEQAWQGSRDLIAELQQHVNAEHQRRLTEERTFAIQAAALRSEHDARLATIRTVAEGDLLTRLEEDEKNRFAQAMLELTNDHQRIH